MAVSGVVAVEQIHVVDLGLNVLLVLFLNRLIGFLQRQLFGLAPLHHGGLAVPAVQSLLQEILLPGDVLCYQRAHLHIQRLGEVRCNFVLLLPIGTHSDAVINLQQGIGKTHVAGGGDDGFRILSHVHRRSGVAALAGYIGGVAVGGTGGAGLRGRFSGCFRRGLRGGGRGRFGYGNVHLGRGGFLLPAACQQAGHEQSQNQKNRNDPCFFHNIYLHPFVLQIIQYILSLI